jgi:hypothetical protein
MFYEGPGSAFIGLATERSRQERAALWGERELGSLNTSAQLLLVLPNDRILRSHLNGCIHNPAPAFRLRSVERGVMRVATKLQRPGAPKRTPPLVASMP